MENNCFVKEKGQRQYFINLPEFPYLQVLLTSRIGCNCNRRKEKRRIGGYSIEKQKINQSKGIKWKKRPEMRRIM